MKDFTDMLKEALAADEPYDPDPGREVLEAAIAGFDRRMRMVRNMAAAGVALMSVGAIWSLVALLRAPDGEAVRTLILYAVVFLTMSSGIGLIKIWFALMQSDLVLRKEVKRLHLALALRRGEG
jgi:hypothetical protein